MFTLIGVLVAVGGDGSNAGPSASRTVEPGGNKGDGGDEAPGLGARARDGDFTFTVTDVRESTQRIGDRYFGTEPQGKFVFVDVKVQNHGKRAQSLFGDNQTLIDGKDRQHSADTEAQVYLSDKRQTIYQEINPGNAVAGTVVFDVPTNVTPTSVQLHDSAFSGGVEVSLQES